MEIKTEDYREIMITKAKYFMMYWHHGQVRKFSGVPYHTHPIAVSNLVWEYEKDLDTVIAAMLHDVPEDTKCPHKDIEEEFGEIVLNRVLQVTDVSKPEDGSRKERKAKDLEHLSKSDYYGATIKLADLIHNSSSVVRHDPEGFAPMYIREKAAVLEVLTHGNAYLYDLAVITLDKAKEQLGI